MNIVLRVRKKYFDAVVRGEKTIDYRKDSKYWARRLVRNPPPDVAVFVCGKRVHRRKILSREFVETPKTLSEQERKDVPTSYCWAIHLDNATASDKREERI